jgi:hypothetical protein
MTYQIKLITKTSDSTCCVDLEGVPLSAMKAQIKRLVAEYDIPADSILRVEQENPRALYFQGVLSSVPSLLEK